MKIKIPRWYQDLSIHQMEKLSSLRNVMKSDWEENITGGCRKILADIGITSSLVRIKPKEIKKLQIQSDFDPVKFLCELYRVVTGSYFQDESYKKFYDCNERIILTSIAFLTLPETLLELHQRLPMGKVQEYQSKPSPPTILPARKKGVSPYLDSTFDEPPDRGAYRAELQKWYSARRSIIQPQVILPSCLAPENIHQEVEENYSLVSMSEKSQVQSNYSSEIDTKLKSIERVTRTASLKSQVETNYSSNLDTSLKSIEGVSGATPGNSSWVALKPKRKISLKRKANKMERNEKKIKKGKGLRKKTDEKEVIGKLGEIEEQKMENNEILLEGDAEESVKKSEMIVEKPENNRDILFDRLSRLENYRKKNFPPGRQNLSLKWQEWLWNVDVEYSRLETQANMLINQVRETTKMIFNPDVCDACCACRAKQKSDKLYRDSKIPSIVIDTLTTGGESGKRYLVNTLTFHSPPESLSGSSINQPFVIPSEDKIVKKSLVNSVVMQNGKTQYQMERVTRQIQHTSRRIIERPVVVKNVAPCCCKHEEEGLDSDKKLGCGEEDQVCPGKKHADSKCDKCSKKYADNEIFIKFDKICRESDRKYEERIKNELMRRQIKSGYSDEEVEVEKKVEEKIEKCTKCISCEEEDKCKENPFNDFLKEVRENRKLEGEEKYQKIIDGKKYRDNIKISVGGMIRSDNARGDYFILSGISLQSPIEVTPEPSEPSVHSVSSMSQHHHWSVTEYSPKYQVVVEASVPNQNKHVNKIKEFGEDEGGKINSVSRTDESHRRDKEIQKKKLGNEKKLKTKQDEETKKSSGVDRRKKNLEKEKINKRSREKVHTYSKDKIIKGSEAKIKHGTKHKGKFVDEEKRVENKDEVIKNDGDDKMELEMVQNGDYEERNKRRSLETTDGNLSALMKTALEQMAEEGWLLAKLPACYEMPPLKIWILYRKGFKTSDKKIGDYLEKTEKSWESADKVSSKKLQVPSIKLSDNKKSSLTYKTLGKIQKKIEMSKKKFYSDVRKHRVIQSRTMWNLMEKGQFPFVTDKFKQTYFIYQSNKESDGFLLRPYGLESES